MLTNPEARTITRPLFSYAISGLALLLRFLTALNKHLRQLTYLLVANKWIPDYPGEGVARAVFPPVPTLPY